MKHPVRKIAVILFGLAVVGGLRGYQYLSGRDDAQATSAANTSSQSATAKQRQQLQTKVQQYLTQVGADNTVSVTFQNLAPVAGSQAAADPVYASGSLSASVNGNTKMVAASTYKLYIAAYLFAHQYQFDSTSTAGFDNMIVNSANDFGESIIAEYGVSAIDRYLATQGWPKVFVDGQAATTTSNSLANVLADLQAGTGAFSDDSQRSWLLKDMGSQVYRTGIPAAAGSTATVQDKVGFLDDVNNDAAIVTTKSGYRFILVIMTSGHNQATLDFSRINTIAKQVIKLAYGG